MKDLETDLHANFQAVETPFDESLLWRQCDRMDNQIYLEKSLENATVK